MQRSLDNTCPLKHDYRLMCQLLFMQKTMILFTQKKNVNTVCWVVEVEHVRLDLSLVL